MFRVLLRLYLITIITFSAAIFLIPKLVIQLFEHRYMDYNVEQTRGLQKLIVKQYLRAPVERWSHVTEQLNRDFAPLQVKLLLRQDASYTPEEEQLLEHGKPVIRLGEWGWMEDISSPINQQFAVKLSIPPDPLDMNLLYWSMNVLIGAALLACLLFWLRPHWRDLERLKSTAAQLGRGNLSERTQIPASSNIGSLASVFDTMADDIEGLLNQQRDLLNAVSHELRTPLTRLDFGLALALSEDLPQASRERLQSLVAHIRELDELVLELLSYSRLQNPAQLPERVDVVLDEFIDSVLGSVDDELENPRSSSTSRSTALWSVSASTRASPPGRCRTCCAMPRVIATGASRSGSRCVPTAVKSAWTMTASAFLWSNASVSSNPSIVSTAAATAPPAVLALAWRSAGAPWKPRAAP